MKPGSNTVLQFNAELDVAAKVLDTKLATLIKLVTLSCYNNITKRNPVNTGYSRDNWRVAVGSPDRSVSTPPGPEARGTGLSSPPPDADLGPLEAIKTGREKAFVTNSVGYVRWLNEGTSRQAPAGWIDMGIAEVEAHIDQLVAQARKTGFPG